MRGMPLLIKGAIKIMREDFDEGELLLYFLEKGDTCAMTMSCCMGNNKSEIRAIAENDGMVLMIPVQKMEEWVGKYKSWRAFVFNCYKSRLIALLMAIGHISYNLMVGI